ncbi:bifunctional hydroxymethylpyrimidine kinase/phosphomethylpyrimidine kinase [Thiococcus pfennigii]|jgi:hydroxymethylpyrimidine/phosphomethylpyrimidine kinase|uniref:bifunctional hydroxymethylpyrimidine kinase/phosphomethylpyrimidine kinase n=1 Tax=Thiococcus pfennigii TaxID=1057 RepID=UPI00190401D0|nr:hydroxymethylpyrimidine/phosphomethylpyrimidine kinase [Thiococcus pfennigii]MBK1702584.1 hydroxymethylpyrimidine/phosphomethylpyrimidine kinase [Thiococcus pfennigii]MBK1733439.1 hydroxymethylpyrimidine/phosphomethylpyrimidine kinase [Thiococcus pfennigii]
MPDPSPPIVLCAGGHDPTGGAGLTADAEAVRAAGAHALGLVTCLTTQDTCGVGGVFPQPIGQIEAQWRALSADSPIAAIKIGLLGSAAVAEAVEGRVRAHPGLPVVLDPVLASGAGDPIADAALVERLRHHLPGACTLMTPNLPEARTLAGAQDPDACAAALRRAGCRWVLITGTHAAEAEVVNRLYGPDGCRHAWRWPRLPGHYHGSGCTLASAIAARLARGDEPIEAIAAAQAYTWEALARARRTGRCQLTPNRLFALDGTEAPG